MLRHLTRLGLVFLFLPALALAQTTVSTISGPVLDSAGHALTSGSLQFTLENCGGTPATGNSSYTIPLDASGNPLAGSNTVTQNPSTGCVLTSYWQVAAYTYSATLVWQRNFSINSSTFNVGTASPLTPVPSANGSGVESLATQALSIAQASLPAQIPTVWSGQQTYAKYALAIGSDGATYISTTSSNTNNNPTASGSTYWRLFASGNAFAPAHDLTGSGVSQTVVGIQGNPVAAGTPSSGQVLVWNGSQYSPSNIAGGSQYQLQYYNNGKLSGAGATVDSTGQNFTFNGTISSAHTFAAQATFKGPRIDINFPTLAAGCPNAADPTGTLDSTCEFTAALALAANDDIGSIASTPIIYVPDGHYNISSALRVQCNITIEGDGMGASTIQQTSPTANAITFLPGTGSNLGASCPGGMHDITIEGTGHSGTGTLLEEDNAVGISLRNVRLYNGGGRGQNLEGSTERTKNFNLHIDAVRWPIQLSHNANENHWYALNIANPGSDASGYCWGAMCVNGSYPYNPPTNTSVVSVSQLDSTHVSVTLNGGVPGGLVAGHYASLSGVSEDSSYNQSPLLITSITPNAGNTQYTVIMQEAVNTAGPYTDGTWQIVWRPDTHQAVWVEAVNNWFHGGSLKSTQFIGGFGFHAAENDGEDEFYIEGYPYDGEPRLNAALVDNGVMPLTTTTAAITATSTTVPVTSTRWFPDYINDPQDISNCASYYYVIMPADALKGSTANSTAFPSVQRGTAENVDGCFSGDGAFHITSRGNPAYAWPAGSIIERGVGSDYGSGAVMKNNHINSIDQVTNSGFTTDCGDASWLTATRTTEENPIGFTTCGDVLIGETPDDLLGLPNTSGNYVIQFVGGSQTTLEGNAFYTGGPESVGEGYVKAFNDATITSDDNAPNTPYLTYNQITSGSAPDEFGSSYGYQNITYGGQGGLGGLNLPRLYSIQNIQEYGEMNVSGENYNNVGTNPGMHYDLDGLEFVNSYCYFDAGATHATTRWCYEGAPYFNPGAFSIQMWNGTSWVEISNQSSNGAVFNIPLTANSQINANGGVKYYVNPYNTSSTYTMPAGMEYMAQGVVGTVTMPTQVTGENFMIDAIAGVKIVAPSGNIYLNGNSLGTSFTTTASGVYGFLMDGSNYSVMFEPSSTNASSDPAFPAAPTYATTYENMQKPSGYTWTACNGTPMSCGGGSTGTVSVTTGVASPSLSGNALQLTATNTTPPTYSATQTYPQNTAATTAIVNYNGGNWASSQPNNTGNTPASGSAYWTQVGGFNGIAYLPITTCPLSGNCGNISNIHWHASVYFAGGNTGVQAWEIDPDVFTGTWEYQMSFQCDSASGMWRLWNNGSNTWVTTRWPCSIYSQTGTWHTLTGDFTINTVSHTYSYQSFQVDGKDVFANLNQTYNAVQCGATGSACSGDVEKFNLQTQMDNTYSATSNTWYIDNEGFEAY